MQTMNVVVKFSTFLGALLLLVPCLFVQCQSQSQNQQHLPSFSISQVDSLQQYYAQKLKNILLKDPTLSQQIKIDSVGIHLFAPKAKEPEFKLTWQALPQYLNLFQKAPLYLQSIYPQLPAQKAEIDAVYLQDFPAFQANAQQPLSGWRIALDPGHFAENMETAMMEGKYIKMDLKDGTKVRFFESELAWFTARILADELEALGAKVLLSRNSYKHTAFEETYMAWYKKFIQTQREAGKATAQLTPQQAFYQHFRKIEFEKRAEKINQFRPHLTLIIHYNVDATNDKWTKPTPRNNSMAFAGGAFMANELDKAEARFHLLRLLLTDDLEQSVSLSKSLLTSLEDTLGIKPVPEPNEQFFLKDNCLKSEVQGVYFRNLTLARKVIGKLSYLEPLYQDNQIEIKKLNTRDFDYKGQALPKRIYEVALAYKAGILAYLAKH